MGAVLGRDAVLSIKQNGADDPSSWSEIPEVLSVSVEISIDEVDVTSRSTAGFKAYLAGLKEFSLNFEHNWDSKSTSQGWLLNAAYAESQTTFGFQIEDGTGGDTLVFDGVVTSHNKSDPLDGAQTVSVVVRNTNVPVYTDTNAVSGV